MVALLLITQAGSSPLLQVFLFFGFPLQVGWMGFHGLFLTFAERKGYLQTLFARIPHGWVSTNLAFSAIIALSAPFAIVSVQMPLPLWTVAAWWAFAVAGGLVSLPLLLLFNGWSLRHGFFAWNALAWGEGEVRSASWKTLRWRILLSYAALIGGIAIFLIIQKALSNS
jgi:hypothetical protein